MPDSYFEIDKQILLEELRQIVANISAQNQGSSEVEAVKGLITTLSPITDTDINLFHKTAKKFIVDNPSTEERSTNILTLVKNILEQSLYIRYKTTEQTPDMQELATKSNSVVSKGHKTSGQDDKGKEIFQKTHDDPDGKKPISQIEACASLMYRLLVGRKHATKVVEVFKVNTSGEVKSFGTRSDAIPGFMDYTKLKKHFADLHKEWNEQQVAEHVFGLLTDAGLGKVYAALRFGQEDDLTTRNLAASTHIDETGNLIVDKVVIFDVDRSFGSAIYGHGNKYGIAPRPVGWSSSEEAFAITFGETNDPSAPTGQGMYYGPTQNPLLVKGKNKWTDADRFAFKKICKDSSGKFLQDFDYTLFKVAYLLEPVLDSSVNSTVRNSELRADISTCLITSMQYTQNAMLKSSRWRQAFWINHDAWKTQAIAEIEKSKEFKAAWVEARKSNPNLPEDPRTYIDGQFSDMSLKLSDVDNCLSEINSLLKEFENQLTNIPLLEEKDREQLMEALNIAVLLSNKETSKNLTKQELFEYLQKIDEVPQNTGKSETKVGNKKIQLSIGGFPDDPAESKLIVIAAAVSVVMKVAEKQSTSIRYKISDFCRNIFNLLAEILSLTKKMSYRDVHRKISAGLVEAIDAIAKKQALVLPEQPAAKPKNTSTEDANFEFLSHKM